MDDIFEAQDEITRNVVATIEPHLYAEEGYRANSKAPETLDSWSLVVRALTLINKLGRKQNEEAQALLRKAIEIEPTYARAHAMLAWAHAWAAFCLWEERQHGFELAGQSAERALVLDPDEPWARMASGFVHSLRGQHDVALEEFAATIRLNPSFALAHTFYGVVLLRSGRFEAALDMTSKALRMSPADTFAGFYNSFHALALLVNRRFAEALLHARAAIAAFPEFPGHYNLLICCCGYLEMTDEAKAYLAHHDRIAPPLTCGGTRQRMEHFAHRDIYVEGLAKAGVPE